MVKVIEFSVGFWNITSFINKGNATKRWNSIAKVYWSSYQLKGLHKAHSFFWVVASYIERNRLDFKRDRSDLKGTNSTAEEKKNWGNSLQIKNPLKGSIIFRGREKKLTSLLRETAGNRKLSAPLLLWLCHIPHHEKPRLIVVQPLFSVRGRGRPQIQANSSGRPWPHHSPTNKGRWTE